MNARAHGFAKGSILLGMIGGFALIPGVATAGSDSPTPYTVTADGITLPAGVTFPAHGHVNWRTTSSSGGIHFDPNNNQPGGAYIGASFLPISLAPGECITWVQISLYDEHYGEGGQDPICKPTTTPTEEPTWTPEPTTPPAPTPDPSPSTTSETPSEPSHEPSESPTTQPAPSEQPSSPTAEPSQPSPTPEPPSTEPEQPSATPDPTEPTTTPAPIQCEAGFAPGWLDENGVPTGCVANGPIDPEPEEDPWTPTPSSQPSNEPNETPGPSTGTPDSTTTKRPETPGTQPAPTSSSLAVTGSNDPLVGVAAAALTLLLGAYLYLTNHRRKP